jgi:uncharacterized protein YjcR
VLGSPGKKRSSWLREVMSSLMKTLRKWYCRARELMNSQQIVVGALTDIERYTRLDFVREDYLSSYDGDRLVESMRVAVAAIPLALGIVAFVLEP